MDAWGWACVLTVGVLAAVVAAFAEVMGKKRRAERYLTRLLEIMRKAETAGGFLNYHRALHSVGCEWVVLKRCDCEVIKLRSLAEEARDAYGLPSAVTQAEIAERAKSRAGKVAGAILLALMACSAWAEAPETITAAKVYFAAERIMSSAGPAQDEAGLVAFGQLGFGRIGVGGWLMATGTIQPGQLDVTRVRVLEVAIAPHWYAAQHQGVAVGPTVWLGATYGYGADGVPLVTRSPATWGAGARIGGHGAWAVIGWGDHQVVGRGAFQALAHLPMSERTALNADLAQSGQVYQVRLRACLGW